jgi:putative oxidoreductase
VSILYRNSHGIAGSLGLLVLRAVVGAAFVLHGWPKIQSPFNWMGPDAPFPGWMQLAAAVAEFGGGIAIVLGALTPLAALALAITMGVAIAKVHVPQGHAFVARPGEPSFELAAAFLAAVVAIFLLGPGRISVDALLFGSKSSPAKGQEG